jgi:hypothetical protein
LRRLHFLAENTKKAEGGKMNWFTKFRFVGVALMAALLLASCGGGKQNDTRNGEVTVGRLINAIGPAGVPETGWWWNPAEGGRGFAIEVQGDSVFMAGFMYEADGQATWYVSSLARQLDGSYRGEMTKYIGGQTLLGAYKVPTGSSKIADVTAMFETSTKGAISVLPVAGQSGQPAVTVISVERFPISTPTPFAPSQAAFRNGWYWNDAEGGRGYFVEVQGTQAFVGAYVYSDSGQPTWHVSTGKLTSPTTIAGEFLSYTGGQSLVGSFRAPTAAVGPGSVSIQLSDSSPGAITFAGSKTVPIKRFTFGAADAVAPATTAVISPACIANNFTYGVRSTNLVGVGKNASATVAGCSGAIDSPKWVQVSGPPVSLLTDKTQTISFEAALPGSYVFALGFKDGAKVARSEQITITAAPALATPRLLLRGTQSVRMGGKVSVRAWPKLPAGEEIESITWTQVAGPTVTLDTTDQQVAFFTAPDVAKDTVIQLRATLRTRFGVVDSDDAVVLVERYVQAAASNDATVWGGDHVSRTYAYRPNSPYAAVLPGCVYDAGTLYYGTQAQVTACNLFKLPFLAQTTGGAIPTVEQVMDRVVVSHDWLGKNFETFLRTHDTRGDFRRLLNGVTAVVLGTQVRPSFYNPLTGAIYLDADNFWLAPQERDTINEAPDYRSEFGSTLKYADLWRYVQNNKNILVFYDSMARVTRGVDTLLNEAGALLYHELGHASDFLPPGEYINLISSTTVWGNLANRYNNFQLPSDLISRNFPLTSTLLKGMAEVKFQGQTSSAVQRTYTPEFIGSLFEADLATDDYAYSSTREDVAMMFEEFMVASRLGIARDVAFTDPIAPDATSAAILVRWGQRGRVGTAAIKPRLRFALRQIAPWMDITEVDRLPAPVSLRLGDSWRANLNLNPSASVFIATQQRAISAYEEQELFNKEMRRRDRRAQGSGPRLPPR